ncbi:MAG: hypothetical protein COB84_06005 [Rhodobacteraceae bacterium]|nr:MAG: hypothetical protein COB84_06005 [Paracoccaceae bacterium]
MLKHRGFPSRFPSSDFQFTIRRAHKKGATKLVSRERYADRKHVDRRVDEGFMRALWENFGDQPFERGNLDAGRLSWLLGREVVAADDSYDPEDYETLLKINVPKAMVNFPDVFDSESA